MTENKILLSILIPTVVGREKEFANLMFKISPISLYQFGEIEDGYFMAESGFYIPPKDADLFDPLLSEKSTHVQLLSLKDNKEHSIGDKRELLYHKAKGIYSIQVDDDDELAPNAIQLILEAIKSNPNADCITFEEHIDIDGKIQRSNHSLKYGDWNNNEDGYDYVRTPFMKSVIKTEIARSVPIPHIRFGEDHQWAQALKPHLKTEIHIDEQIYRYIHRSSNHNARYGIKD